MATVDESSQWLERDAHWPGYAAVVGGLINIVIAFTGPTANVNEGLTIFWVGMFAQAIATGLMLFGLYGLHRRYGEQYGRLGVGLAALFGTALAWMTFSMLVTGVATVLGVFDAVGAVHAIEGSWFAVNFLSMPIASLYGIALWRSDVLRVGAITMTATMPVALALIFGLDALGEQIGFVFWVPLGVAWIVTGYVMVRDRASTTN